MKKNEIDRFPYNKLMDNLLVFSFTFRFLLVEFWGMLVQKIMQTQTNVW